MLLVVGLDGATWAVIRPLMARGEMPVLEALCRKGASGQLRSTIPPVTFPAWSTFMTGVNPGKHGIFDFTAREFGSYGLRFVSGAERKAPTLWRMVSDAGGRVGVLGVPATYPPEPVNGFMISGFDSPLATGIDRSFVFPAKLYDELHDQVGDYRVTDFQELRIGQGWHRQALQKIHETLELKSRTALYLLGKEQWDLFMVLFGESDTVSHHFWMFHDPASPRFSRERSAEFSDAISSVYRRLDVALGALLEASPEETTVVVLSDHGFGGAGTTVLRLNAWLANHGYLKFERGWGGVKRKGLHWARSRVLPWVPRGLQEWLVRAGGGRAAGAAEARARFSGIDWADTRAFSEELNYAPGVWIHLQGRDPLGKVSPEDYEQLRDTLIRDLEAWKNPYTGERVVKRAYRREGLYHGPCVDRAPDIVLEFNLDRGYSYCCLPTMGGVSPPVSQLHERSYAGCKGAGMNGSHRREGIIALCGPSIRAGMAVEGELADVAPTILYLMGRPVPLQMDGEVMTSAIEEQCLLRSPVERVHGDFGEQPRRDGLKEEEAAEIRRRLVGMGYLGS